MAGGLSYGQRSFCTCSAACYRPEFFDYEGERRTRRDGRQSSLSRQKIMATHLIDSTSVVFNETPQFFKYESCLCAYCRFSFIIVKLDR